MKPMLAHVWEPHRVSYPCYVQPKFNGVRAVCGCDESGQRRFQSRDELPWDYSVLEHISRSLDFLPKDLVLDGELYRHGWPLQKIAGACAVARGKPSEDTLGLTYVIFDVVDYGKSFIDRLKAISSIVPCADDHWGVATTILAESESQVNKFYSTMVHEGFEGIMYRLGDCPYTVPKHRAFGAIKRGRTNFLSDKDNRTWHVLKRKSWQDGEYPCLGIEEGVGKRQGMVGAFVCSAMTDLNHPLSDSPRFRVGSGLSDHEATHYFQHPELVIGHKIKVKFLTLTSDGIPFNPTFEQLL